MSSRVWRRLRARHVIVGALLFALGANPASAQRTSYSNFNSWYILAADAALGDRWSTSFDLQERRSGPIRQPQAFFFRPSVNYAVASGVKLGFGMTRSESYPFGKIPIAYQTPEWRIFEQLQLAQTLGRVQVTHRYRIEQRWQGKRGADTSDHKIASWLQSGRARYQVKTVLPLHGQNVDVGSGYLAASDEAFISFGKNVANNVFDQNRAAVAFGLRYAREWKAEAGFLQQTSLKSNGKDLEQNATLTFGLYYTRETKKKE
jgi:Protein of unknown function (DUF2490)